MKQSKKILILSFLTAIIFSSCKKDFLNKGIPQDALTTATFYQTAAELKMATAFLYSKPWFDYNYPFSYDIGELQSGNIVGYIYSGSTSNDFTNFDIPSNSSDTKYGWSSLFNVIANSNVTMLNIEQVAPASLGAAKTSAIGEARFMRGIAYFQLVQIFGPVPLIADNNTLAFNPNLRANVIPDVYRFIINDLRYAAANLPLTNDPGRVTQWSAKGLLAKVYLTRAGISGTRAQADLDSAKFFATDVAENSGLNLMANYADVFLTKNNNNPECLFGLQWTVDPSAQYGNNDERQTFIEGDGTIAGDGGSWGGLRISADLAKLYSASDLRRKATFMQNGDTYPELISTAHPTGYTMTDTTSLYIKKYVTGGPLANNGANITAQHNNIPTYLLRLSDVYLVLAEATLGNSASTTDPTALLYFNKVHVRAGLPAVTSLDFQTIFTERRLELAGEIQFWFDIKRWHDYNPAAANAFVMAQHRNMASYATGDANYNDVLPVVTGITDNYSDTYTNTQGSKNNWTMQYPAADVTGDPLLTLPPVPYYK
jgi:hypothetical protein